MKYAWAAYKKGVEAWKWVFPPDMDKKVFTKTFNKYLDHHGFNGIWTIFGETREGRHASGMMFSWLLPKDSPVILISGQTVWFPWATKRNILEGTVGLVNALRQDYTIMDFTRKEDVPFLRRLDERYGLTRPVGLVHDVYDQPATLYQSRKPPHMRVY